jgi:hypothetical protein
MRLKLEQIPKRTLEVERPDGTLINLVIKRFRLKDVPALEAETRELELKRRMGEVNTQEYYNAMISLVTENFDADDFAEMDVEHLQAISEAMNELRKNKPEAEKKSPA